MEELNTVLVTGYSKAPQGTSMYEIYKYAGIVMEIDFRTHVIVNVEFTYITELSNDFFKRLIINYDLSQGLEPLAQRIRKHIYSASQQAVIIAIQAAVQRYWDFSKK